MLAQKPTPSDPSSRSYTPLFAIVLGALVLAVYWPTFQFPFVNYDDPGYITMQPNVLRGWNLDNVRWAFTTLQFSNWHPLTWLSYLADISLFGINPGAMHMENVALHALNGLLLLWLLHALTGRPVESGLVALWFALHPLRVESVAWISERKDLLSTLFGLLAIILYVAYARRKSKSAYAATLLLFACSLMAKPMLVTLPALLLLLDWWPLERMRGGWRESLRPLLLDKLPLLALALACAAVAYHAQSVAGSVLGADKYPLTLRLQNALASYGLYIWKTVVPADLAVFYPYPSRPPLLPSLLGLALVASAVLAAARMARRADRGDAATVGLLWFAGTLIPVIGIVQVGQQAYADRYTYFPSIGLFLAAAWGIAALLRRLPASRAASAWLAVGCLSILPLALLTRGQVSHWRDSERLWTHALESTENNYVAHGSLGQYLQVLDRDDEAMMHLQEAARIRPDHPQTYSNIGLIHEAHGRFQEAEQAYRKSHELAPFHPIPLLNLGSLYLKTGRRAEAESAYKRVLELDPQSSDGLYNLGLIYSADGRRQEALEAYRQAAAIAPDSADIRRNLAVLLTQLNQSGAAAQQYAEWLRLEPRSARAHNNLANELARLGQPQRAVAHYQQAAALDANYADPLVNLGTVQLQMGNRAAAEQAWLAALRIAPDNAAAASRLQALRSAPAGGSPTR